MNKSFKTIAAMLLLAALFSCEASKPAQATITEPKEVKAEKMLLGKQSLQNVSQAPYSEWYQPEYDGYKTDAATMQKLKEADLYKYQITTFLGTWCEDSHREFPRFVKILQEAGYPEQQLEIVAVDRTKSAPNGEEVPFDVHKVPTFIIQKDGKQIGRIIEYPKSGFLEKDLLEIINKAQ